MDNITREILAEIAYQRDIIYEAFRVEPKCVLMSSAYYRILANTTWHVSVGVNYKYTGTVLGMPIVITDIPGHLDVVPRMFKNDKSALDKGASK